MANLAVMLRIERRHGLSNDERSTIGNLIDSVTACSGHRPIPDQLWLDLHDHEDDEAEFALIFEDHNGETLIGYAQASPAHGSWTMGAVVEPGRADRARLLGDLARTVVEMIGGRGGGTVHWWVLGDDALTDQVALDIGLHDVRSLLQMRIALPVEPGAPLVLRPFRTGHDEDAWLAVNNSAFSWHAEQGGWDLEMLQRRERESWFDPAGFLLHERDARLAGFCWTKIHHDTQPVLGEIYVIAVHPDFHGLGLGRALTSAGLTHLADRGVRIGMLYVDGTNAAAIGLYTSMGFVVHRTDRAHFGSVPGTPHPPSS